MPGEGLAVALVNSIPEPILVLDTDGVVVLANRRAEALLGYAEGELDGQGAESLLPETVRLAYAHERTGFIGGPPGRVDVSVPVQRKDGVRLDVELALELCETAAGRFVTVAVGDTAARRRLAQSQKLESIGRLATGVAHDFNNALTSISAYAHLALSRLPPGAPVHEDVRQIVRAAENAGQLVTQLQAFSQASGEETEAVDLNRSVRDVSRLLNAVVGESIAVELRLAPRLPVVDASLGAIEQAVMHLALNARDALPGQGRITISTTLADGPGDRQVVLGVADTGAGMDEPTRQRAFEPFFSTRGSAGLGLTMVSTTAERLGGHVELDSAPGQGTAVRLFLPVSTSVASQARVGTGRALETVLMVEDEEMLRTVVERILADEGYTVLSAASAEEALELAAAEPGRIDLLVSDVVLGGMTGPELATKLRARRPALKILLMSGYPGMPVGPVDDFLAKPFSPFELARRIRRVLRP